MEVSGIGIFVAGCLGGAVGEFLGLWRLRTVDPPNWPEHYKRLRYWLISLGMIIVGGTLAVVYSMDTMPVVLAVNIGASAPLALQSLASATPPSLPIVPSDARIN